MACGVKLPVHCSYGMVLRADAGPRLRTDGAAEAGTGCPMPENSRKVAKTVCNTVEKFSASSLPRQSGNIMVLLPGEDL